MMTKNIHFKNDCGFFELNNEVNVKGGKNNTT